jgi:hypothetical protein
MEPIRTITSPGAAQQTFASRPAPVPVANAVATDLPAAKSVTAANAATPTVNNATAPNSAYQYQVIVDPGTNEVVYRTVDERSRQVIRQVPDQALLRMRAYAHALAEGKTADEAHREANLRA